MEPVYFAATDYAGFWRRIFVECADALMALLVLLLLSAMLADVLALGGLYLCFAATVYCYFVVLKRSRFHTLGYRLGRVRIVDAHGQVPSRRALSLRLLFAVAGPFNIVFDMLWIPSDPWKQSLRDKVAHTYVVTAHAHPAGPARVVYRNYYMMGMSIVFQEIEPVGPARAS
jgi:hypothetical protein